MENYDFLRECSSVLLQNFIANIYHCSDTVILGTFYGIRFVIPQISELV